MEEGVLLALKEVVTQNGQDCEKLAKSLKIHGRLHLETY
jgi:benzoyl-CoA 2,3-dioxygenase component A